MLLTYCQKCCVGLSYGVSFPLTLVVLDFWLKDLGVSNTVIGFFTFLHLPFTLKFIWGVFVENYDIPYLSKKISRSRSWIVISHTILIAGIIGMAFSDPKSSIIQLIFFASVTALGDGCKSVVLYPYQIDRIAQNQWGYVASLVSLGHKIGMISTKTITLYMAYFFNWKIAYLIAAAAIFLLMILILYIKSPQKHKEKVHSHNFTMTLSDFIRKSLVTPLKKIFKKKDGPLILFILMLYKSADFMMQKMSKPFLLEIGFSKLEIANIVQIFGAISVVVGGLIGGYFIKRIGFARAMIYFGLCHAVSFLFYLILVKIGAAPQILGFIIFCEAFTGGSVTSAFITFIYTICKTGSMYALFWALHEISGIFFMSISGIIVDFIGWNSYFILVPFFYIIVLVVLQRHDRILSGFSR
jgi:PAT family beta-lactamase induction signal transducer AmpG